MALFLGCQHLLYRPQHLLLHPQHLLLHPHHVYELGRIMKWAG